MLIDWLARLLLSPVLIAQALYVRRSAQSLPEAAGPRDGTSGHGPALHLRIIGDSSAAGVGVANQSEGLAGQLVSELSPYFTVHWHLDAAIGETTRSTLSRLETAPAQKVDIVVTALGVNDVTRLIPLHIWNRQQAALRARLRTLYSPQNIYMSGVPPVGKFPLLPNPLRWTLGRQAQLFETAQRVSLQGEPGVTVIPFDQPLDPAQMASDGFHPSAPIYKLWAKGIASQILSDWPLSSEN